MPQSRLPDVNTAIIVYRRESITDLKSQNYSGCIGGLNALNAMLPKEYRVVISTKDYEDVMKEGLFAICKFCKVENDFRSVKIINISLTFDLKILTNQKSENVWFCGTCKKQNKTAITQFNQKKFKQPYYMRVVPNPPIRKEGILSRTRFDSTFVSWFWTVLGEIEAQLAQFRDDNWKKPGSLYDLDEDLGDTGEENF